MIKAAVIGDPISHSLSPHIFSFLSKHLNKTSFQYGAVTVSPENLSDFFLKASREYIGVNVTLPHKEATLRLVGKISEEARCVGAVNCISFGQNESVGFNTDVQGFTDSLLEHTQVVENQNALVLGAGGAAKAVVYALAKIGYREIYILNKSLQRGEELVQTMSKRFRKTNFKNLLNLASLGSIRVTLIVNATPLGMQGFESADADEYFNAIMSNIKQTQNILAFDLIYRPEETTFLTAAKKHHFNTVGGLDMLIYQALSSWQIWFGPIEDKAQVKESLRVFLKAQFNSSASRDLIFLTGFMGVGKSTVGRQLAHELGFSFVDTDDYIEKKYQMKISELFAQRGEGAFRDLESQVLKKICEAHKAVIALGGGALMRNENLHLVQKAGVVIYLSATSECLCQRLKRFSETRPLLQHDSETSLQEHIAKLLAARIHQYKKANLEVNTDELESRQVVAKILRSLTVQTNG